MSGIWHSIIAFGKLWGWVKGSAALMIPEQREWLSRRVISADCFDLKRVNHFLDDPKALLATFQLVGVWYYLRGFSKPLSSTDLCCYGGNHYVCITQGYSLQLCPYIVNVTNVPYISIWPPSCSYYALESSQTLQRHSVYSSLSP